MWQKVQKKGNPVQPPLGLLSAGEGAGASINLEGGDPCGGNTINGEYNKYNETACGHEKVEVKEEKRKRKEKDKGVAGKLFPNLFQSKSHPIPF